MKLSRILSAALLGLGAAGVAQSAPMPVRDAAGRLTTPQGLSLYVYARDSAGRPSTCAGPCAALWPPYLAGTDARPGKGFSLIARDGSNAPQWAWHGMPLYRYAGDSRPGQVSGDRINSVWHLAR